MDDRTLKLECVREAEKILCTPTAMASRTYTSEEILALAKMIYEWVKE